ncbi:MAG: nucleoside triphosphate pyrophosphohydrolase [Cyanobacteria bacterium REEB65]|nr:nucleoside triphosphate pyrophosphohydrolase [Cyanobacteria bacterium REEB65]
MITIVGLGPGDPEDLTGRATAALRSARKLFLRTEVHPTVSALEQWGLAWESFDVLYQEGETFERVYAEIVQRLLSEAAEQDIVYAVPGHPLVGEKTVQQLLAQSQVRVQIVPGLSALDAIFARLRLDPTVSLQVVDALEMALPRGEHHPYPLLSDRHTLVLQVFSPQRASEVKLALMAAFPDEHPVTVLRAANVPGQEKVAVVPLYEVDRLTWVDHLTSFYLPPGPFRGVPRLEDLMHRLRAPGGCPWDAEQTHQSLRRYCLEEAYEVVEAIDLADDDALEEELGDLLLQVVFHAELAAEDGRWTLGDVADRICDKLVARHPNVFGETEEARSATEQLRRWEELKAKEKPAGTSAIAGVALALPALVASEKLQSRASRVGFAWQDWKGALSKLREEVSELEAELARASNPAPWEDAELQGAVSHEVGDVLTALVNLARYWKLDPEQALREANSRFVRRFQAMERAAGGDLSNRAIEELLGLWAKAKAEVG